MDTIGFDVDPRFVDYYFPAALEYSGGYNGPGSSNLMAYADAVELVNPSDYAKYVRMGDESKATLDFMVQYINNQKNEGACHLPDTDVLTEKGWTPWPEYNWTDLLGTVNPTTHELEFQSCQQRHVYEHDGDIVYSMNRRVDFAVTPNHRMMVRKWDERLRKLSPAYSFQEAGNLGWYTGLLGAPSGFVGTELNRVTIEGDRSYDGNDFMALLAIIASDGYASSPDTQSPRVSFCCFRESSRQSISELAQRTGFTEQPGRPGVWYRQGSHSHALGHWLRRNMYTKPIYRAPHKKVPDIVKIASKNQILHFLKFFGDQSHTRVENPQFYSSSKRLIDDLQELHLRVGRRGSIGVRVSRDPAVMNGRTINSVEPEYVLSVAKSANRLCLDANEHLHTERYKGEVYCATVPNGTLITRRNGTVLISGNCVGNGSAKAFEVLSAFEDGPDRVVKMSAMSLYKQIGESAQSGAVVMDAIDAMTSVGFLPLDCEENRGKFAHLFPATGFSTRWPAGWQETAKLFKAHEWNKINTFAELVSSLLNGHPVVVGREGHCIVYLRVIIKNNRLMFVYANSWGEWGQASGNLPYGFGVDTETQARKCCPGAYSLRSKIAWSAA